MARIPIECIVDMKLNQIRPMRVRYENGEGAHVIKVDNIVGKDAKKVLPTMNNPASIEFTFRCEAFEEGLRKFFTLTYDNQSCKWHMFI